MHESLGPSAELTERAEEMVAIATWRDVASCGKLSCLGSGSSWGLSILLSDTRRGYHENKWEDNL